VNRLFQHIRVEKSELVGTIIIDRQDVRNALNKTTVDELQIAVRELEEILS